MRKELFQRLVSDAKYWISNEDPSHDIYHAMRVLDNALYISSKEGGDIDIIVPAALFHDVKKYSNDDEKSTCSAMESALLTEAILKTINNYDKPKIRKVMQVIEEHPYKARIKPGSLESMIIQDADRLEAIGAISIMRVFSSTGQMCRPFYSEDNPFCESRKPESNSYALDFFYDRSLNIMFNTKTAMDMSITRVGFVKDFINQLRSELETKSYLSDRAYMELSQ